MLYRFLWLFGVFGLGSLPALAQDLCPKVACDCAALPNFDWAKECLAVESQLKTACVLNNREPKGFCGIHGPNAKPVPLAVTAPQPVLVSGDLKPLRDQLNTALWSLKDDLASLHTATGAAQLDKAAPLARLFDDHLDQAFSLQTQLMLGFKARSQLGQAEDVGEDFVKAYSPLLSQLATLAEALRATAATGDKGAKSPFSLSQRLQRSLGKAHEQQAWVLAQLGEAAEAAKALQAAARVSEAQVRAEQMATQKLQYISYYQQQASARWYRASFYWAESKNDAQAMSARRQAEQINAAAVAVETK
jgi:hypothetical protein